MTTPISEIEKISSLLLSEDLDGLRAHLKAILAKSLTAKAYRIGTSERALLLRVGVHYVSRVLGTWLRAVLPEAPTDAYSPFGRFPNPDVLEKHWDRFYNLVPSETNWFVDEGFVGRAIIVFGAEASRVRKRTLFLSSLDMDVLYQFLNTWPGFAEIRVPRDGGETEGSGGWPPDVRKVARVVARWLGNVREAGSSAAAEFDLQAALFGLLYTWSPTLTASSMTPKVVWVAYMQAFPEQATSGEKVGMLGALFAIKTYPITGLDQAANALFSEFDPSLDCLLAAESQVMAQLAAQGTRRSVTVERIIRRVRFASAERVKAADRWQKWRDFFPVSYADGGLTGEELRKRDAKEAWDNVPLWGASERFNDLCKKVGAAIDEGETSINKNGGGVHCLFFWSQPGTGKEGLSALCHYLAKRSHDEPSLKEQFKKIERIIPQKERKEEWRDLLLRLGSKVVKDSASIDDFLHSDNRWRCFSAAVPPRWKLNKIDINCSYLSRLGAERELFGYTEAGQKHLGLLTKASWVSGTIFFDEFNTLSPEDASLFLRWTEKPFTIEDRALGTDIPLNLFCIFASNKSPGELKRNGWNEAVFSRIAKPGRTFEIPALSERPEDIALSVAKMLCRDNKLTVVDAAGLRLLCELKWPGNYRQLAGFVATLLKNRGRRAEISFQNILDTLISEGMTLGPGLEE